VRRSRRAERRALADGGESRLHVALIRDFLRSRGPAGRAARRAVRIRFRIGQGPTAGTSGVAGIRTVVLKGDPGRPGLYTIMLRVPPKTRIAAHSHADDAVANGRLGELVLRLRRAGNHHGASMTVAFFVAGSSGKQIEGRNWPSATGCDEKPRYDRPSICGAPYKISGIWRRRMSAIAWRLEPRDGIPPERERGPNRKRWHLPENASIFRHKRIESK